MIHTEQQIRNNKLIDIAKSMAIAARTAPKARGIDNLFITIIEGEHIQSISQKMKQMYEENQQAFFLRDAENILLSCAIVLIGTKISPVGLDCGLCGYATCALKNENKTAPCMFNSHDLGIAIGSATSVAADNRVDSRVMYSVGLAAKELGYFTKECDFGFGIPLSASGKNPFFDRPTIQ